MNPVDVSDSPLVIDAVYTPTNSQTLTTVNVESQFPTLVPSALAPFLTEDLVTIFNNLWSVTQTNGKTLQQQVTAQVNSQVPGLAAAQGVSISNVGAAFPSTGTVMASATSAVPASGSTPEVPGALELSYLLEGCTISFHNSEEIWPFTFTGHWHFSLDATLTVSSAVPATPFTLAPTVVMTCSNAQLHADNVVADAEEVLNFLANIFNLGVNFGQLEADVDANQEQAPLAPIQTLVNELASFGPMIVAQGFSRLTAGVVNSALTFGVVHPDDPAPILYDLATGSPDQPPSLNSPALALSAYTVGAGAIVQVTGTDFPAETADQLTVAWDNTSSGQPLRGDLRYRSGSAWTSVSVAGSSSYQYTATGLQANESYEFQARCEDLLTASAWSAPLHLKTDTSKTVELYLNTAAQPDVLGPSIGSGVLATASGPWAAPATIPTATAPGDYFVTAYLDGAELASAPITVVAAGTPIITLFTPGSNPPAVIAPDSIVLGGQEVSVKGADFTPGPVSLTVDGQAVAGSTVADAQGEFEVDITAPGTIYSFGTVTISAKGSNGTATVQLIEPGQPQ